MQFFFKLLSHSLRRQRVRELEQATPFRAVLIHLLCGADDWLKVAWINDSLTTRWRERTEVKHRCDLSDRRIYHLHWLLISCQCKHRHHRNHHHPHQYDQQQHQQQQYKRFECWPRARCIIPIARYSSKRRRPNWAKIKLLVLDDAIQVIHDARRRVTAVTSRVDAICGWRRGTTDRSPDTRTPVAPPMKDLRLVKNCVTLWDGISHRLWRYRGQLWSWRALYYERKVRSSTSMMETSMWLTKEFLDSSENPTVDFVLTPLGT